MTTCIRLSPHPPTRAPSSPILYSFTPTSAHPRPLPARFARPQHPPPRHGAPFVRGSSGYARCGAAIPSPGARKRPRRTPEDGLQPNGLQWTRIYIYIYLCVLILFRQLVRPNHTTKDQMPPPAVSVVPPARWPKTDSAAPAVVAWTWLQSTRSLDWSTLTFFFSGFRRPVAFVLFERIILNLDQPSERYGHKTFQQC